MSQAVPVRLNYGQELAGIDLYLRQARKLTIRGQVIDGITGMKLMQRQHHVGARGCIRHTEPCPPTRKRISSADGDFEIPSVSPGSYGVFVRAAGEGGKSVLTGHTLLVVGSDDVDGLDLIASPALPWTGRIAIEGAGAFAGERTRSACRWSRAACPRKSATPAPARR